jgi:serine/threonine-protein kinase
MSRVYLARDPVVRRQVAVKVLRDDLGLTPEQQRELADGVREEARAAATLSHPILVALHDMGDDERAGLYLVQELVRGPTLRERLHEGPLSPGEVAAMARSLGSALTHAHGAGLVHRGIRPENIMLTPTGFKLTDFGLSQHRFVRAAYSAPEIILSGAYTPQSDQFSLATTLYEALTGKRAFPGEDRETIAALVVDANVVPPRSALLTLRGFLRLDTVFAQAFAKKPGKRFATCDAFGTALAGELDGPRITFLATPGPVRPSITRTTRRWQNALALVAVGVIAGLLLLGRFRQSASMQRVVPEASQSNAFRPSPSPPFSGSATSPTSAARSSDSLPGPPHP